MDPDVILTIDRDFAPNGGATTRLVAPVKACSSSACISPPKLPFGWVRFFPPCVNRRDRLQWLAISWYPDLLPPDTCGASPAISTQLLPCYSRRSISISIACWPDGIDEPCHRAPGAARMTYK